MTFNPQKINIPNHVAFIMDGNGRWAIKRQSDRLVGHEQGVQTVEKLIKEARKIGVRYITLYAFSSENWSRPKVEVDALMTLFDSYLNSRLEMMLENGIRLRVIGRKELLSEHLQKTILDVEKKTESLNKMDLCLAISYGSREEIVDATKKIAEKVTNSELKLEDINEDLFARNLYAPDIPNPDLLIRTSGESRVSNFLLWQIAYSEIVLTDVLWPDFNEQDFHECLTEYSKRERRYGLTSKQIDIAS